MSCFRVELPRPSQIKGEGRKVGLRGRNRVEHHFACECESNLDRSDGRIRDVGDGRVKVAHAVGSVGEDELRMKFGARRLTSHPRRSKQARHEIEGDFEALVGMHGRAVRSSLAWQCSGAFCQLMGVAKPTSGDIAYKWCSAC